MRILAGWESEQEIELLKLYLNLEENEVEFADSAESMLKLVNSDADWDIFLYSTSWPDADTSFEIFQKLLYFAPEVPVLAATQPDDVYRLARFLTAGLRSYLIRDSNKDYMFLLQAALTAAIDAVKAERERLIAAKLRQEIDSVRKLQESIIPRLLQTPAGYHIQGRYEPAEIRVYGGQPVTMAGGDYYNALSLPDGNVAIIVGDASGHGMKACMSIMTLHTLIQMIPSQDYRKTAEFITEINRNLSRQAVVNDDGGFITLMFGVLNPREQTFEWTSAGHPLPILQRLDTDNIFEQGDNELIGMPLGIWEDAEYECQKMTLPQHSRLLLYTDGLAEAYCDIDGQHQEFGIKGICEVLQTTQQADLPQTISQLFRVSHDFTRNVGRHDDTSVLLIQYDE